MDFDMRGVAATILAIAFALTLRFLFEGDPDVWDLLRQGALTWLNDHMCPIR